MADIHGCFDEFQAMLEIIKFSRRDRLILAGDCLDRGRQNFEMLCWLSQRPKNVMCIRGNHEEEFLANVSLMLQANHRRRVCTDLASHPETAALYSTVKYDLLAGNMVTRAPFDAYHTIGDMLLGSGITMGELIAWSAMIEAMPYYIEFPIKKRRCMIVHAGYCAGGFQNEREAIKFYLYSRGESFQRGAIEHGMVIAGHTPTILPDAFCWNDGRVFRRYNEQDDCVYYYIDCGCVYRRQYANARLSCIRIEDEAVFYV